MAVSEVLSGGPIVLWKQKIFRNSQSSVAFGFPFALNILSAPNCLHLI